MENVAQETEKAISGAIKVDEKEIRDHLDGLVRQSVKDTLNALLNAEADVLSMSWRGEKMQQGDGVGGRMHRMKKNEIFTVFDFD